MGFTRFFSKQARKPTGLFGRWFVSRLFENKNLPLNNFMYCVLSARENDQLLEIGCGPGALIRRIADSLERVHVEGVDFSKQMIAVARQKNKKHWKAGDVVLQLGDFDAMQYERNIFDAVYSVNTVYFWQNPKKTIKKIFQILKPGGRVLIGYHDKADMKSMPLSQDIFQLYSADDMKRLLSADFLSHNISLLSQKGEGKPCYCAVGIKS